MQSLRLHRNFSCRIRRFILIQVKIGSFFGNNGRHFGNGGHFEFENVKFCFLDLKNPRKVLLHDFLGPGKRTLHEYSQFPILDGGHFEKWPPF